MLWFQVQVLVGPPNLHPTLEEVPKRYSAGSRSRADNRGYLDYLRLLRLRGVIIGNEVNHISHCHPYARDSFRS